jgi:fructose-1-phosphate kinase PfkB-like protein
MTPGYSLADKDIRLLFDKIQRYLPSTTWMIVAGSLPKGCPADTYARMIELAAGQNVKTLLDCRGIEMKEGIKSRPDIVKMNNRELKETFGREAIDLPTTGQATFSLLNEYNLESVVVTCGKKGIVAAVKGDGVYYAVPPQLKAVNSAGAGDAVSAVLAYRFTQGDSWSQALQWSGAVSAAVVVTEATAVCDEKQALTIYPRVRVSQVNF